MKRIIFIKIVFIHLLLSGCESFRVITVTNSTDTDIVIEEIRRQPSESISQKTDTLKPKKSVALATSAQLNFALMKTKESNFLEENRRIIIYIKMDTIIIDNNEDLLNLINSEHNANAKPINTDMRSYNIILK